MNDTNSYMFDIQSIIFVYINTVPLILNCFQHLKYFYRFHIIPHTFQSTKHYSVIFMRISSVNKIANAYSIIPCLYHHSSKIYFLLSRTTLSCHERHVFTLLSKNIKLSYHYVFYKKTVKNYHFNR